MTTIESLASSLPNTPAARDIAAAAVDAMSREEAKDALQASGHLLIRPELRQGAWSLVQELVVAIGQRGVEGLDYVIRWLGNNDENLTEEQRHRLANRLAWVTRGAVSDAGVPLDLSQSSDRFLAYLTLERSRFAFDKLGITAALANCSSEGSDPAIIRSFAFLVKVAEATTLTPTIQREVDEIWQQAKREGVSSAVADITLHAFWLAFQLEQQGEHLLALADRWLRSAIPETAILHFRRATALRLVGRYDEAIREAEIAMRMITGTSEFARTFGEQCLRERELSVAALSIRGAVEDGRQEIERLRTELEEVERRSVTRSIEVVTLFTAAAAFAIGAINVVGSTAGNPRGALIVLGGFGGGLVAFAALIIASLIFLNDRHGGSSRISGRDWLLFFVVLVVISAIQVGLPLMFQTVVP